jgi:calcium/calmodulin-dependent protein kinase (CaM kinase) II
MTAQETDSRELLDLTQQLLGAIAAGDWETYQLLCAGTLTAFEPEARGHLVEGLDFHQYYFSLQRPQHPTNTTIAAPHVRLVGSDAAIVSYIRLVQDVDEMGKPQTSRFEETRVWQKQQGQWRHVHFHRSANS